VEGGLQEDACRLRPSRIMRKNVQKHGSALVEFAGLLPFFVCMVFLIFQVQMMMARSCFLSNAAFVSARKAAVDRNGAGVASKYVGDYFGKTRLPGGYRVLNASTTGGSHPQQCRVQIQDSYTIMNPVPPKSADMPYLDFRKTNFTGSVSSAIAAGTSYRVCWSDNEVQ